MHKILPSFYPNLLSIIIQNTFLLSKEIFKLNKIDVNLSEFLEVYEPINLRYWKMYREERVSKTDLRYGRLKDAFDSINVSVEDDMINHLSVAYIDYLTTFNHLFDGTFEILEYLQLKYHICYLSTSLFIIFLQFCREYSELQFEKSLSDEEVSIAIKSSQQFIRVTFFSHNYV